MDIVKISIIAIVATVLVVILKEMKGDLAFIAILASSVVLIIMIMSSLSDVILVFSSIVDKTGVDSDLYEALLKIIGIGYLTEFSANICEDAGCKSLSSKVVLGGKIAVLILAVPIIQSLLNIIISML